MLFASTTLDTVAASLGLVGEQSDAQAYPQTELKRSDTWI